MCRCVRHSNVEFHAPSTALKTLRRQSGFPTQLRPSLPIHPVVCSQCSSAGPFLHVIFGYPSPASNRDRLPSRYPASRTGVLIPASSEGRITTRFRSSSNSSIQSIIALASALVSHPPRDSTLARVASNSCSHPICRASSMRFSTRPCRCIHGRAAVLVRRTCKCPQTLHTRKHRQGTRCRRSRGIQSSDHRNRRRTCLRIERRS